MMTTPQSYALSPGFREANISCGADGIFHYAKISKHQRQEVLPLLASLLQSDAMLR